MKKLLFAAAVLLFLFFGCKDETVQPSLSSGTIQPLKVGNSWAYIDTVFGPAVSVDTTIITVENKFNLTGAVNENDVYTWKVTSGGNWIRTNFIKTDSKGLWHYGEVNGADTLYAKKQWVMYPVKLGDSFSEPRYVYDSRKNTYQYSDTWNWRCVSLQTEITLSIGKKIKCIVFQAETGPNTETLLYYSPDIGYAGWRIVVSGKTVFVQTLQGYNLN